MYRVLRRPCSVRLRIGALALALGVWLASPAFATAQTRADLEVRSLEFTGNEAFSDARLAPLIQTAATSCVSAFLNFIPPICPLTDWGFAHTRRYLDEGALDRDRFRLQLFYRFSGYLAASVDTSVVRHSDEGEAEVTFSIDEGPLTRIDSLVVVGLEGAMRDDQARDILGLGAGDPFDQWQLDLGADSLVVELRDRGYIEAAVLKDAFVPTGQGAEIVIEVYPGQRYRIDQVQIEGAEAIGEGVVRRLVDIPRGAYYSDTRREQAQRTLFALDAVRFASVEAVSARDSFVDLRVRITPANTRAARAGFGVSTDECLQIESRLTHRNFLGGAKRLQLTTRLKNLFAEQLDGSFPCTATGDDPAFRGLNFLAEAELSVPVFFSRRNSLRSAIYAERESVPDVFIREGVGGRVSVTRDLGSRMTATLSYQPAFTGFAEESADVFFCVNFGFCTPEDVDVVTQARWLAPLDIAWVMSRTDDALQPTRGHYLNADVELAESFTGSAYRYVRLTLGAAGFVSLGPDLVLGARARGGTVEPSPASFATGLSADREEIIHPSKRFFAGGSQSVRGVGQNLLGPRVLVLDRVESCMTDEAIDACIDRLAVEDPGEFDQRPTGGNASFEFSLEARQTLTDAWGVVGFLDVGQVWERLSEIRAPLWSPGVGLRYRSPIGPLRLDVGYNTTSATTLPVVAVLEDGELVEIDDPVLFDPFQFDDPSGFRHFLRRLQFHFSIGEAF